MVGRQLLMHDALENKTYLVATSTSAQDSKFASLQHVRATLHLAGWMLSPNPENNSEIFVTYIVHIDPSGSIPSRLLKLVSTQTPLCIAGVYDYLNTHGTPMDMKIKCVEGVDDGGFVTLSKLDQSFVSESGAFQGSLLVINSKEKSDAESSLASASSLVVELNVCKYMYPGGVDLEISAMYRGNSNSTPTAVPLDTIINVQVGYNEKDIKLTVVNPAQLEYGGEYIISIKGTKGKRTSQRVFTLNGQPIAREETKAAEIAVVVDSMQSHKQRQLVSPTSEAPALASSLLPTTPGSCSNINSITFRDTRMLTKNTCTTTSLAPPSFPPHQHSRLIENVRQRMMHNILEFPPVEDTEKLSVSIADDGIIRADRVFRNVEDPSRFAESLFSAIQCQNSRR